MDAQTGLLMAVKQVDLEMGGTGSEERKQSMVTAMQQEIALLKDLQHENIVQYLGEIFRQLGIVPHTQRELTLRVFTPPDTLDRLID
jgi:hypothetical protein